MSRRLAVIYDVHGNLAALDAVLAEVRADGIEHLVCGGDVALFGAHPAECVERLRAFDDQLIAVRGNCDRYLLEPPDVPADEVDVVSWTRAALGDERVAWLGALPTVAAIDEHDALVVHASPRSDEDVILPDTDATAVGEMLAGMRRRLLLCGHVHIQYRRDVDGTELVNPGSVGLPADGDQRAAWAVLEGGKVSFRRTAYDVDQVIAELEAIGHPNADVTAGRLRRAAL
jgi:putative phosphoesterase